MMDPERILKRLRDYRLRHERFDQLVRAVLANRLSRSAVRALVAASTLLSGQRERQFQELTSSLARERQKVRRLRKQIQHLAPRTQDSIQQIRDPRGSKQHDSVPQLDQVSFGNLRRVTPISREFGYDRGTPIDRYYIENFLARQARDIRGHVLEIKENSYTRRYGGNRVEVSDVLDVAEDNRQATIVADLTRADHVPSNTFDSIIFTQTLQLIYDIRSTTQTLYRILKPGGLLLATFPGISQISYEECGDYWCWAFTRLSVRRLFGECFPEDSIRVEAHGNVLVAMGFLHGLATEELLREELDYWDPDYEVLITLRAVKPGATP